jgi:hypothetical protein
VVVVSDHPKFSVVVVSASSTQANISDFLFKAMKSHFSIYTLSPNCSSVSTGHVSETKSQSSISCDSEVISILSIAIFERSTLHSLVYKT